ncbi:MAG: trypsin-like peptidase domain-containing protein [Candidatus Doudnabacteria bacterium]|nr:trypsin-like peptidase domain-containing protein [Candidatus Doudnabacteria bacterium]
MLEKKFTENQAHVAPSKTITLNEDSAIIDVVKKARPAVVSIVATRDLSKLPGYGLSPFENDFFSQFFGIPSIEDGVQEVGAGSGFLVSGNGLILTNKHVVSDTKASYTVLTNDGKKYDAKVVALDPLNDLAIVKIEIENAPFLDLADSSDLEVGQRVVAIGNALGEYQNSVTSGIVSGIGRTITAGGAAGSENLEGVIQTDAAINPGNSGGPLINLAGQVVGINTAVSMQGQSVGFAIPSLDAERALSSYNRTGKITRPFLGVRYVMLNKALAESQRLSREYGALLVQGETQNDLAVLPNSPADKAGLREDDIILEVEGQKLEGENTLAKSLKKFNTGDEVTLKVFSKGSERTVKVKLEDSN